MKHCLKTSAAGCIVGAVLALFGGGLIDLRADDATGSSPAFEEYRRKALQELASTAARAEKDGRLQTITNLVNQFKETGEAGVVRVLVESDYSADEIVPHLQAILSAPNSSAQQWALIGLRRHETNASAATAQVLQLLKGDDEVLSSYAAATFVSIAPPGASAVAPLSQWLRSGRGDTATRLRWMEALRQIGPPASSALPALEAELAAPDQAFLTNRSTTTAYAAFQTMAAIRNEPPLAKDELLRRGPAAFTGETVHRAFKSVQTGIVSKDDALNLLNELLRSPSKVVHRIQAVETLGELRPSDSTSLSRLVAQARQTESQILSDYAVSAILKCAVADTNSVQFLLSALDPANPQLSRAASRSLVQAGPVASTPTTVNAVVSALGSADGETDLNAIAGLMDILRALGPRGSSAQPTLTAFLPVDARVYQGRLSVYSMMLRKYTLLTLADIGLTEDAIPAIVDELANAVHLDNRAAAARAAGVLPKGQEAVVPYLQRALEQLNVTNDVSALNLSVLSSGSHPRGRSTSFPLEIIRALVRIGPPARPAIPVLLRRAQDPPLGAPQYNLAYQAEAAKAAELLSK